MPSGFSVLRFSDRELPDIVYVEHLTSALYMDKQSDVARARAGSGTPEHRERAALRDADILEAIMSELERQQ